jgi:uncharacterized protein YqeY
MSQLADEIKKRMFAAMKAGNTAEKEILRVATGEITMTAARESRELSDEDELEESVLLSLLPKALSVDELVAALTSVADAIRSAPGEGPAMGAAMKALKSQGITAEAKTVTQAIQKIRS